MMEYRNMSRIVYGLTIIIIMTAWTESLADDGALPPVVPVPQLGPSESVYAATFRADGRQLLTASGGTAILWDVSSGKQIRSFGSHRSAVIHVDFSPDGRRVLTNSFGAIIWDSISGEPILSGINGRTAFLPNGREVVTIGGGIAAGGTVSSRTIDRSSEVQSGGPFSGTQSLGVYTGRFCALSPDIRSFSSVSEEGVVALWDIASGEKLYSFTPPGAPVYRTYFGPKGKKLLTGSTEGDVILWDVSTGKKLHSLQGHDGCVLVSAFSHDGKKVIVVSAYDTAILWDTTSGKKIFALKKHRDERVCSAEFSPDGKKFVTGSVNGDVILWDAASGQPLHVLAKLINNARVFFSPDGRRLLAAPKGGMILHIPESDTGSESKRGGLYPILVPSGRAIIFDAASGKQLHKLKGRAFPVTNVWFTPDGKEISIQTRSLQNFRWITTRWDLSSGRKLSSSTNDFCRAAAGSPDGRTVFTAMDNTAVLWDLSKQKQVYSLEKLISSVRCVDFSPNGKEVLAGADDGSAIHCVASSGKLLHRLKGHEGCVKAISFSSDGKRIITAALDDLVLTWDAASGKRIRALKGYASASVESVALSPDLGRVLTGLSSGEAILWDISTGEKLHSLKGHAGSLSSVAFSPNGQSLLTGSKDGTTILWDAKSGEMVAGFCAYHDGERTLVWTPEGQFAGENQLMSHRKPGTNELYPPEITERFNNPRELAKRLQAFVKQEKEGSNTTD